MTERTVTVSLLNIKQVQGGDLCFDTLNNSFFFASPGQIGELRKRNISFWVVDHPERSKLRDRMMKYHEEAIGGKYPIDLFLRSKSRGRRIKLSRAQTWPIS